MSTSSNPHFDVPFVLRSDLPHLPTADDPGKDLAKQVPSPFGATGWSGAPLDPTLAITVLSMLDEPVEAVACHAVHGELGWVPVVRTDLNDAPDRSPTHEKAGDGLPGIGWIDPAGYGDMVSVGTWTVSCSNWGPVRKAAGVLHLRCTDSKVDILVGGLVAERLSDLGGENPYNIALYEPGAFHPSDDTYQAFYDDHVDDNGTWSDREGNATAAPVYYLARTPQGHKSYWWHVLVFLGPRPVKSMWDEPAPSEAAADSERSTLAIEDAIQRGVAVAKSGKPADEQKRLTDAVLAEFDSTPDRFSIVLGIMGHVYALEHPDGPQPAPVISPATT